jgi:predicted transcriptional regulator
MRIKLLRLFIRNPQKKFYLREISKLLNEPLTPVRRELLNLKQVGFLRRSRMANLIFYDVDPNFIIYEELKSMVEKTEHLEVT